MKIFRTVAITLSLLLSNISTSAHEDGSEECFTGPNIPGKEHQPTPDGALSEANISVMINGVTLDSSSVSVFDASVSNEVTIAIDGNVYYGFYAYFSGDMDGSDALSVLASDMSGQVKAGNAWEAKNGKKSVQCDVGVSVAQHTTMDVKTTNDFGMQVASGGNAVLEVIVMTDWIFGRYYYTAFSLEFEGADDDLLTTDSPTAKPSSSPVVAATSNPTAKPSSSPVVTSVLNPTSSPITTPTSTSPVVSTVDNPVATSAALPQNIVLPFGVLVLSAMFMLM